MPCILKKTYIRMSISALLIIDKKPEGWYGAGGGRGVQDGEHVYIRGGFMLMYGKTTTIL